MLLGRFRHTITIQRATETTAAGGRVVIHWNDLYRLRAEMLSSVAVEGVAGNGQRETTTLVFRTHYRAGITTADRISHDGQPLNIVKIEPYAEGRGLELHCEVVR